MCIGSQIAGSRPPLGVRASVSGTPRTAGHRHIGLAYSIQAPSLRFFS
jgi:hypothetical protein